MFNVQSIFLYYSSAIDLNQTKSGVKQKWNDFRRATETARGTIKYTKQWQDSSLWVSALVYVFPEY